MGPANPPRQPDSCNAPPDYECEHRCDSPPAPTESQELEAICEQLHADASKTKFLSAAVIEAAERLEAEENA